jgi:hypothetical protein
MSSLKGWRFLKPDIFSISTRRGQKGYALTNCKKLFTGLPLSSYQDFLIKAHWKTHHIFSKTFSKTFSNKERQRITI